LYDEDTAESVAEYQLGSKVEQLSLSVEHIIIPRMNDLIEQGLPYTPTNDDVILTLPGSQFHLAMLLDIIRIQRHTLSTMFLCHSLPSGKGVEWQLIQIGGDEVILHANLKIQDSDDQLESILANVPGLKWVGPQLNLVNDDVNHFILLEASGAHNKEVISALSDAARMRIDLDGPEPYVKIGKAFETVSGFHLIQHESISEVQMNIEFAGDYRNLLQREEDFIALTIDGFLIYGSCKFWSRKLSPKKKEMRIAELNQEIKRMESLNLPFGFPKERIRKMLITTTPILDHVPDGTTVIVTNLERLHSQLDEPSDSTNGVEE
jgi:hypothetical protein